MLWLKSKTQLTIIPNEATVMSDIKTPNIRIELKNKNDQVGKVEEGLLDISQL